MYLYYQGENQSSGGGEYKLNGEKIGIWEELNEVFWDFQQIMYIGEYYNGKKIGIWKNSLTNGNDLEINKQIWGGLYDEDDQGLKNRKWIEISQMLVIQSQVIDIGEYKNGQMLGKWDCFYRDDCKNQMNRQEVGHMMNKMQEQRMDCGLNFVIIYEMGPYNSKSHIVWFNSLKIKKQQRLWNAI
ncbi:unnamed protein product [Paramecium pentaurelia]|uniref:MORN repeat protein n=1 Tax=Paramecium pentaurelia TaxID=43138 RepID=A0A8S1YL92_9CILI|nr:unnamed protein product [Paramecium pentaurelia]